MKKSTGSLKKIEMKISPHKYQVKAVQHWLDNPCSALFLDMGLGKTVISLTGISNLLRQKQSKGFLIMAPLRVIYNVWPLEIEKWNHLRHLSYGILHGDNKDAELKIKRDIYLVNYEGLKWLYNKWRRVPKRQLPVDGIIFDESTSVKSRTTARFKMLRMMIRVFKYRLILTGTPAPNSLLDLWAQYYLLDGGDRLFNSWYSYRNYFFYQADYQGYKWEAREGASVQISQKVKDITMRLKAEDYLDMPKLFINDVLCQLPRKLKSEYDQLEEEFIIRISDQTITAANAAVLSAKLRQFVSGAMYTEEGGLARTHDVKLDTLQEVIEDDKSEPILIGINFRFEYDLIKTRFPTAPVVYGGIDQRTSSRLIKQWNEKRLPLLVVHPLSIAHGINLQSGGRKLIWYSIPWSFEQYTQLNHRLYRQGQTKPVIINRIIARETVDVRVANGLSHKEAEEKSFLNNLLSNLRRKYGIQK